MKNGKNYWEPVYEAFCQDYPNLAEEMVDWYPSAQLEITVKIRGGKKYAYDFMTRQAYLASDPEYDDMNDISEEEWRKMFARNLNRKMRNVSMTQDRLADKVGISQVTISKYTNGLATPNSRNLIKMARALKCSIHELVNMD